MIASSWMAGSAQEFRSLMRFWKPHPSPTSRISAAAAGRVAFVGDTLGWTRIARPEAPACSERVAERAPRALCGCSRVRRGADQRRTPRPL